MKHFFFACVLLLVSLLPCAAEPSFDKDQLVGHWRYHNDEQRLTADYEFRQDGTFKAELRRDEDLIRSFEGRWLIKEQWLVYIYDKDSIGQIASGGRERDHLSRIDESSYTIESTDNSQRTYWRVKDE